MPAGAKASSTQTELKLHADLAERLQFETLLADLSSLFLRLWAACCQADHLRDNLASLLQEVDQDLSGSVDWNRTKRFENRPLLANRSNIQEGDVYEENTNCKNHHL